MENARSHIDIYIKTEIDSLMANIVLNDCYNKAEIHDTDNGLPTLILNTYTKHEIYTFLTDYYNIEYFNIQFDLKANVLNTYTSEVDNIITPLGSSSMLTPINNNGANITNIKYTTYKIRS